jgi:ABC-type branched-subunit amino acid transport system substrate-binding protein
MSSSHARSRLRRIAILALPLTLLAASCSNSDDGADAATSAPAVTTAADAATTTLATNDATAPAPSAGTDPAATAPPATSAPSNGSFEPIEGVPGVTDDEIAFAVLGTQANNPLGTCVLDCYVTGIQAYFDWRNSEGGVHGRQLVVKTKLDDELANNQQRALEIVSANDTFATFSAVQLASGWADLADAGIPLYVWMIHPAQANGRESIFGTRELPCILCAHRWVPYVANAAGATKVASIGYGVSENSKQCAESNAASVERYGADLGVEIAYVNDDLAFGLPNGIGPEVTAMKDAGVDFIAGCIDLNGMKTLGQELERQGMLDQVTMYHSNTYDQNFVNEAGGLFEGDYVQVAFRPFEADAGASQMGAFLEWMGKSGYAVNELAVNGWINADLAYQGVLAAGSQFDRASVIAATNTFTEYTAGGLTQPIDFTRQHVPPADDDAGLAANGPKHDCIAVVQVIDGEFVLVGDPAKPWTCWPGATSAWSEPVAMNFE